MTDVHHSASLIETERGGGRIRIGENVKIGPNVVIYGPVNIGDGVKISSGVVIGEKGEAYSTESDFSRPITIGQGTIIREHAVVQRGLIGGVGTEIGEECYIMHGSHVAHDVRLHNRVTLSPFVVLGGHATVMSDAVLGISSATHQWVTIGSCCMVGMNAAVIHDLPPGCKATGVPARITGVNTVGLSRAAARAGFPLAPDDVRIGDSCPMYRPGSYLEDLLTEWQRIGKRPGMKIRR